MNAGNWRNRHRRAEALARCLTVGHEWCAPCPVTGRTFCRRPGCLAWLPGTPEAFDYAAYRRRLATEPFDDSTPTAG